MFDDIVEVKAVTPLHLEVGNAMLHGQAQAATFTNFVFITGVVTVAVDIMIIVDG